MRKAKCVVDLAKEKEGGRGIGGGRRGEAEEEDEWSHVNLIHAKRHRGW